MILLLSSEQFYGDDPTVIVAGEFGNDILMYPPAFT
jgi:hypothetical protein